MWQQRITRCGAVVGWGHVWAVMGISGVLLAGLAAASITANAQECAPLSGIERLSVAGDGTQGNASSVIPALNANGCIVAFKSYASNLIPDDTNGDVDVFVRDRSAAGTTQRIPNVPFSDTQPKGNSYPPALDPSGEIVAFGSEAANLIAEDFNQQADIFVYVRSDHSTEGVSLLQGGNGGGRVPDQPPSVNTDGKLVVFTSPAGDFVPGDENQTNDVFVFDRDAGTRELISEALNTSQGGRSGNGSSSGGAISLDGCTVAFYSFASNLVADDTNHDRDVFVRHRCPPQSTERVNVSSTGQQAVPPPNGRQLPSVEYPPGVSEDGRYVAFVSDQDGLDGIDSGGFANVFVRDLKAPGATIRVSNGLGGAPADGPSQSVSMSADGRFVVFQSAASNLVDGDTNDRVDIFVAEVATGKIQRVSLAASGAQADRDSTFPQISGDGKIIAFQSDATNLIDGDTNGATDIFLVENLLAVPTPTPTPTPSEPPTPSVTATSTLTATVTVASTATPSATQASSATRTPTQATPTPTAGDSCGAVCSVGQGCRREVGGQIQPGECVPDQQCLCIVGGTATPIPTATATPPSGGGGGGGGGGCGCRIDPDTGQVADAPPWLALALPAMVWFGRRQRRRSA